MKYLYINGELNGEAEKIIVTDTDIIGYNGEVEVFSLKGVSFNNITYKIKDEQDNEVQPDKTSLEILQETVDQLILDSLGGA